MNKFIQSIKFVIGLFQIAILTIYDEVKDKLKKNKKKDVK